MVFWRSPPVYDQVLEKGKSHYIYVLEIQIPKPNIHLQPGEHFEWQTKWKGKVQYTRSAFYWLLVSGELFLGDRESSNCDCKPCFVRFMESISASWKNQMHR